MSLFGIRTALQKFPPPDARPENDVFVGKKTNGPNTSAWCRRGLRHASFRDVGELFPNGTGVETWHDRFAASDFRQQNAVNGGFLLLRRTQINDEHSYWLAKGPRPNLIQQMVDIQFNYTIN